MSENGSLAAQRLIDLRSLSIFGALRDDPLVGSIDRLLRTFSGPSSGDVASSCIAAAENWAAFALALAARSFSLRTCLAELVAADENAFTLAAERSSAHGLSEALRTAAAADLGRLSRLAALDPAELGAEVGRRLREAGLGQAAIDVAAEGAALAAAADGGGVHPATAVLIAADDWGGAVLPFAAAIRGSGAGKLGIHRSFVWSGRDGRPAVASSALLPVRHPDPIRIADLSGYEDQRSVVVSNTLRFLEGKKANNLLLYGDRGTGKSATVKAVCNEYADRGVRLVEVRKEELAYFSDILETLADRAHRFIVFVDDLTFERTDDSYTGIKALLEGGAEARPDNVVVYATSNRRHLVKERFADRPTTAAAALAAETGDVRAFDTMQEQLSLADRFGVTVVFAAPSQEEYLAIAEFIAESRGLLQPERRGEFRADALRWERWFNGRSPRTARQYVDWMEGGEGFPWE